MARVQPTQPRTASEDDLLSQAKEYSFSKKQIEYFEAKVKTLRDKLFAQIEELGEVDTEGHIILDLPEEIDGIKGFKKQRRVQRKVNEAKCEEIIQAKNLGDELYKTIRVIDEDKLMAALYSDQLTEEEVEEMYPQQITWALTMDKG
jgi:hypothetical protein